MKMENKEFKNRVFGAVILKSLNSNFNADFTHHPRTLPDGVVYSTDKALKYAVKDYFRKFLKDEKLLYIKRYNESLNPFALDEAYGHVFKDSSLKDESKLEILGNILKCLDVKLFGATFAPKGKDIEKKNISIHGPVQINHGINRYPENDIYTEDILSPFRNPTEKDEKEKGNVAIGNQTNLKEGHYIFHFSINPKNTDEFYAMINTDKSDNEKLFLLNNDLINLKTAFNNAVTTLDSSRKIGTENEATLWLQLNEGSTKVIPSLTELISVQKNKQKVELDFEKVSELVNQIESDIETVEVYFNPVNTEIKGMEKTKKIKFINILNENEI